jgi:hypothetical protein
MPAERKSVFLSSKRVDIQVRKELIQRFVDGGASKAEARRMMLLELLRREIRLLSKELPRERMHAAIDEAYVQEIMES